MVMSILGSFLYLFVASSLLGLAFGLLTAFCLRKMHIQHTAQVGWGGGGGSGGAPGIAILEAEGRCMRSETRSSV